MSLSHTRSCRDTVTAGGAPVVPDGDLRSQAKILEFAMWHVDEAVQQNGARYSFSNVG